MTNVKAEKTFWERAWSGAEISQVLDGFVGMYDGLYLTFSLSLEYPEDDLELSFEEVAPFVEEASTDDWSAAHISIGASDLDAPLIYEPSVEAEVPPTIARIYCGVVRDATPEFTRVSLQAEDRAAIRALLSLVEL